MVEMASFGQRLMRERERRGLPRARVAKATEIYIHDLAALEFGDFDALPDDPVVEGFVRTYAEFLDFDVEAIVEDFQRSRAVKETLPVEPDDVEALRLTPEPSPEPVEPPIEAEPPPAIETARSEPVSAETLPTPELAVAPTRPGSGRWLPVVVVAGALVGVLIWWSLGSGKTVVESPVEVQLAAPTPPVEAAAPDTAPSATTPRVDPTPPAAQPAAVLRVTEHGVGSDVVDRRLVGEADHFVAGSRVWFWNRVRGGTAGGEVRHVWIHDGRIVESIALPIGSSNWRTQSAKQVYREGRWAVEAREPGGSVLARSEFDCVP